MPWQIPLAILIIVHSFGFFLNKVLTDKIPKKSVGMFYQYFFSASIVILYALFSRKVGINATTALIAGVGFLNAFSYYYQWRAFELNLSKTVLFFPLAQVLTIVLAIIFLKEFVLWNNQLIIGIALSFLAIWLFQSAKSESEKERKTINRKWLFFVVMTIVIWAIVEFIIKLSSFTISRGNFVFGWYIGALLGSILMLCLEKQIPTRIPIKIVLLLSLLSITFLSGLLLLYWTYQLGGPISLVIPLQYLGITLISVLVGWFLFKERRKLSKKEWLGFIFGICGAILILFR